LAHRVISLLRSNRVALGAKLTSTSQMGVSEWAARKKTSMHHAAKANERS
jgi:hypothetical protein